MELASGALVRIAGGGIFGLACAWRLARRGVAVRVHEARTIGAGSSGGHVGALAPHVPENWNPKKALQLTSLLGAADFWAEIEDASGLPSGYGRTGRIQPVADRAQLPRLQHRIEASRERWPRDAWMSLTDAPGGLVPDSPTGLWLHDGLTARLNPRAALEALAGAIRAKGGEVIEGDPAPQDHAPTIWATGTEGLLHLNDALGRRIGQGVKGQSLLLRHPAPGAAQVFADGLHVVPHDDGTIAVGSTSENSFDHDRPDDQLDDILARAVAICPALRDAPVIDRWAGLRPRARSRAPILAAWPDRPGHWIANGGFKIGFGMAPIIADLAADAVIAGRADFPDTTALP